MGRLLGRSTVSGWEDSAVVQAGEGEGLTLSRVLWGRSGGHHVSCREIRVHGLSTVVSSASKFHRAGQPHWSSAL